MSVLVACTGTCSWLWAASHPLPTPRPRPLPRPAVREFVCSLLVLLRHEEWAGSLPSAARAIHEIAARRHAGGRQTQEDVAV